MMPVRMLASMMSPAGAAGKLSILIFHRVLPQPDPLFPEEPDAARFDTLLHWIKQTYRVIPLEDAVQGLQRASLPSRALSITFDDGYADNARVAMPILQRHGLHATFFVASGFLDGGRMWNDTVIESVRAARQDALNLENIGLGEFPLDSAAARRRCIDSILTRIKHLPPVERANAVDDVAAAADVELPNDLMMSSSELRQMSEAGMTIGGHTVSHPILASLTSAQAASEIGEGKRALEQIIGKPMNLFAYPNGKPVGDYTRRDRDLVEAAGYGAAVTTAAGASRPGSDLFQLPRFTPWDRSRLRFLGRLTHNLRRDGEWV